jgi:bifunctional non-homologous end joining protein LigD
MMAIGCASNAMAIACRLIARNGYDWTKRYPWIIEAAPKNRQKQFVIDGEAVILGVDGIPISTRCTRASTITKCSSIYGFDILAFDGEDLRGLPLSLRKTNLARLLARRPDGIFVAPFEQGEIGPDLFRAASNMGLEGLVSRRRDRPYRAGR